MNEPAFNIDEFMQNNNEPVSTQTVDEEVISSDEPQETVLTSVELDVQKQVVESLAADKAALDETITCLKKEKEDIRGQLARTAAELEKTRKMVEEMRAQLQKVGDILSVNSETMLSTKITLLEKNEQIEEHFEGEVRDHVLEILKECQTRCEQEGRYRRAQIIESVLAANEPNGTLEKKRKALEKLFADNQNLINGEVIDVLQKEGISHKKGEEYLLPREIIARTY